MVNDLEILWFADRVEAQRQPEAIGQGNLFLHHITVMNLPAHHLALLIVLHVFRHQMTAVAGGVEAHIFRRQFQGALQHAFQMLVLVFPVLE